MGLLGFLEAKLPFRRAKYGDLITISQGAWRETGKKDWKVPADRIKRYDMAWEYYLENQFARAIVNMTASAIFGKGIQFVGDDGQVKFARDLFGQIDLFQLGIESSIYGDNIIRIFTDKDDAKRYQIALLPPKTIAEKKTAEGNVLEPEYYLQKWGETDKDGEEILAEKITHVMINAVSDSLFGNSDLLHLFYWLDMYDSVTEEADKRRLFASQSIGMFTGVDLRYRNTLKTRINKVKRDEDQKTGLRRCFPPGTQLILPKGVKYELVESLGKFNLEEILHRVAKIVAMASETPEHFLNLAEDVNRSTAKESLFPFIKKVQRRQAIFSRKFEELLRKIYDIATSQNGGVVPWEGEKELDLKVEFAPIFDYDLSEIEKMTKAVVSAWQMELISRKSAMDMIARYFGLDIEREEERLEGEKGEREEEKTEEFSPMELAMAEIGNAVARGQIEKEVGTELINKILKKS